MSRLKYKPNSSAGLACFTALSAILTIFTACVDDVTMHEKDAMGVLSFNLQAIDGNKDAKSTRGAVVANICQLPAADLPSPLVLDVEEKERNEAFTSSDMATRGVPLYTSNFNAQYGNDFYGTAFESVSGSDEVTDPWGSGLGNHGTLQFVYSSEDEAYVADYGNISWPNKGKGSLLFFFQAPYSVTSTLSPRFYADGSIKFSYNRTVVDASQDKDILFTSTTRSASNDNTSITMYHAFAELQFKVSQDARNAGVTINSVTLHNVKKQGDCTIAPKATNKTSWTNVSGTTDVSLTFANNRTDNNILYSGTNTDNVAMMLIPQTIADDVTMDVIYTVGGAQSTKTGITVKRTGHASWEATKIYTYTLNVNPETWEIIIDAPDEVSFNGIVEQSQSFDVNCYKQSSSGTTEAVDWTLEYSSDGTNWSSTVPTGWTVSPNSSLRGQKTLSSTASARTDGAEQTTSEQGAILKNTQYIDFDLSYYDPSTNQTTTLQNTANCYVVNGYGTFKFPAVYGNRIKNGSNNIVNLYSANSKADEFNDKVKIENIDSAELVWQDSPGLISSVGKTSLNGYDYVTFTVPNTTVKPGNALIAVKNSDGDILWSWHIWFVEQSLNLGATVDNEHYFMPVNLGWVSNVSSSINFDKYAEKKVFLRIKAGDEEHIVTLKRNAYTEVKNATVTPTTNGYSCFYQWGRKEPLLCGGITVYGMDGFALTTGFHDDNQSLSSLADAKNAIKYPLSFLTNWNGNSATNVLYYGNERWSAGTKDLSTTNARDKEVTKTIYDPCPAGYKIPNGAVMSAIMPTTTEDRTTDQNHYMYNYSNNGNITAFWVGFGYYSAVQTIGDSSKRWYQCCWTATCNTSYQHMNGGTGKYIYQKANSVFDVAIVNAMSVHPILDNQ